MRILIKAICIDTTLSLYIFYFNVNIYMIYYAAMFGLIDEDTYNAVYARIHIDKEDFCNNISVMLDREVK